mgnify:FL=1
MKLLRSPASVQWELTPVCNHNCVHCYNYWRNDPVPLTHPSVDYLKIAKLITAACPVHVVFTGGEPLLVFDKTLDAAKYLVKKGVHISWNTNATLVTTEIAKEIAKLNASAFVSLPCGNAEICDKIVDVSGALDRIANGILHLLSERVPVSVNMVVSSYNIDEIFNTAKFANELGVQSFCLAPASRPFGADAAFDDIAPPSDVVTILCDQAMRIEKEIGMKVSLTGALPGCAFETERAFQRFAYNKSCTAGKISYAIDAYGNVKACARDSKVYGNILEDSITSIWERMDEWRDGSLLPSDCKKCKSLNICHGGCRLEACSSTGRRDGMDTFAKPELIPPKFLKIPPKYQWPEKTTFKVYSNIQWTKEIFGWRVSIGPRFTYVTEATKEWLSSHKFFTLKDMEDKFGESNHTVLKTTIQILANAGIIYSEISD